jgi:ABC-type nitrate/sulfonate/bicarbonate transport system permease component
LPAILPSLLSGLRIGAALAFGIGVAAEYIGAQSGLGYLIYVSRRILATNTILLATLIIGAESIVLDSIIKLIAGWLCRWKEDSVDEFSKYSGKLKLIGRTENKIGGGS